MEIVVLILLGLIVVFLWTIKCGLKFFAASSDDWIVLEWHKIRGAGTAKAMWAADAPVYIEFVPVIGWTYDHWGYKYGKPTPITPPHYHVRDRLNVKLLDSKAEYETISYWIRNGLEYNISDEWGSVDFWETLLDNAIAGKIIEVHGNVPDSCSKRLFEIIAISEKNQKQKDPKQLDQQG
ncbi:MAG: hypothetical protein ACOYOS_21080 [Syntrophales bacterium]